MPRPDGCAPSVVEWQRFLDQIDKRIAERVRSYALEHGGFSDRDIADAHRHFAGLGRRGRSGGSDPDYANRTVPFIDALRFLPRWMTTIVAAVDLLSTKRDVSTQRSVLDVGSGLDSVSLALEACGVLAPDHTVVCVDESPAMHDFARSLTSSSRRTHETTDITKFLLLDGPRFDSVFLSYAFSYEQERNPSILNRIVDELAVRLNDGGFILYSGPTGKRNLAESIQNRFSRQAGFTIEDLSSGWTPHLRQRLPMPEVQTLFNESFDAADRGGLEQAHLRDLTNPYLPQPSWIFTYTTDAQIVFSAHAG